MIACVENTGNCMIDFGEPAGNGIVGRANLLVLGMDLNKWLLVYACNQVQTSISSPSAIIKDEYVWIMSRDHTI